MRLKPAASSFAVAICAVLAGPAHGATCNAAISKVGPIGSIDYDPFDGVARNVTFTVEFQNNGSDSCSVGVAVGRQASDPQRAFTKGGDRLIYSVKLGGGEVANTLLSPVGNVTLPGGAGKHATLTLKIEVPAGLIGPAGTYADVLVFRGYVVGGAPVALSGDRTATAYASVESRAEVNIAGAAGSFGMPFAVDNLDFGVLATGAEKNAFVQVRATSSVTITVTSQNRGKLLHTLLKQHAPGVPYALKLDAQAVNLSGSYSIDRAPPVTLDGVSYPMNVRIGNVSGLTAGQYQDVVTISVCPN